MGFFSWDCKGCGHSVRSRHATNATSAWLANVVVVEPGGDSYSGEYDGYGRVETASGSVVKVGLNERFAMHHKCCFALLGRPQYDGPSRSANDQGYFVGEYDPAEPKTQEDLEALHAHAEAERRLDQEAWERANAKFKADQEAAKAKAK